MAPDMAKCPHCFGEKPAKAKVCLHCGRDEQGFGPMVRIGETAVASGKLLTKRGLGASNVKVHVIVGILATTIGFLLMLSSGFGALLFILGITLLVGTRLRVWWRGHL